MEKLIIQIPCYNEEKTLPLVLKDIPRSIDGIDTIEIQIIDDGSTDKTVEVAKANGVNHIVSYIGNKGLGNAFRHGVENALNLGATILVNTDGDNQYKSSDIPKLVKPILDKKADIVIGNRQTSKIKHFSILKKFLQWLGTKVTKFFTSDKTIKDAVSGFRAYSRNALIELNVTSDFSYVLDTTVQASKKKIKMVNVDIGTNSPTRPSRLFKSMWQHIKKSTSDLLRVYAMYEPFKVFVTIGVIFCLIGAFPIVRFLYFYFNSEGGGYIQSLIFGMMFIVIGVQFFGLGILADLLAKSRRLTEEILKKLKENNYTKHE